MLDRRLLLTKRTRTIVYTIRNLIEEWTTIGPDFDLTSDSGIGTGTIISATVTFSSIKVSAASDPTYLVYDSYDRAIVEQLSVNTNLHAAEKALSSVSANLLTTQELAMWHNHINDCATVWYSSGCTMTITVKYIP